MRKIFFAFAILGCFLLAKNVSAQDLDKTISGVTISPLTFELTANPGDTIINKIKVFNPIDAAVSVKMEAEDFKPIGEEGKVVTTSEDEEDSTYSLRKWVTIIPDEFVLQPGEQKIIDFVIEVPLNAEPGGKYGSILAGVTGSLEDGVTGATISSKSGSLILLMVAGDLKENLTIKDFTVPSFQEYGPVPFEIRFENEGTVHVRPKGYIIITDFFDRKVAELEFPQKNVIPGSIRRIETGWDTKWLFGKYKASIVGVYGTSNKNLEPMVKTFWVIPWKLVFAAFSAILLLLILFFLSRKRLRLAIRVLLKGDDSHKEKDE